jgi:hypothetical protein
MVGVNGVTEGWMDGRMNGMFRFLKLADMLGRFSDTYLELLP